MEPANQPKVRRIGGFELAEKIGQGGMGAVFKARQVSLDRIVALKLLPPKIAQRDPVFVERFFREARSSAKLNHPNIVQGIDVGFDEKNNVYYFAMEYVDGPTVKMLLQQQKVLPERKALEILRGVAQALACAHRAGIVHRDIKPDNVLLTLRGEPKLADLGLARFVLDASDTGAEDDQNASNEPELTQAGFAIGTPSYMSPEQVKGLSDIVDGRSDLYALGATLFHMVTGRPPYVAEKIPTILQMHLNSPVPNARSVNPVVSEDTNRLIAQLMQKEQVDRIQTAELLEEQITRILNGVPERATGRRVPVTTGGHKPVPYESKRSDRHVPADPPSRRGIILIGGAVLVGVLLIVLALLAGGSGNRETPSPVAQNGGPDPVSPLARPSPTPAVPEVKPPPTTPESDPARPNHPAFMRNEPLPKWPPLDKAVEAVKQKPDDYENLFRLFQEAERGAPPELIAEIRHQRNKVEREQIKAFRKILEESNAKAQGKVAQRDFAGALALLSEENAPRALLGEYNRGELAKLRLDVESRALDDYLKTTEPGLYGEYDAAGLNLPKLEAFSNRLAGTARKYATRSVLDEVEVLRRTTAQRVQAASATLTHQQDAEFQQLLENAVQAAAGELREAEDILNRARNAKTLPERFNTRLQQLLADLKNLQGYYAKTANALAGKVKTDAQLTLHPKGMTVTGKLVSKGDEALPTFVLEDHDGRAHTLEINKLDAWDVLTLSGTPGDSAEGRYAAGICYFWQGKTGKAYDTFEQLKEGFEANRAAVYVAWVDDLVQESMARVTQLFKDVRNNPAMSLDDKKKNQAKARAEVQRLKVEFTEAYRAQLQKK